MQIGYIFLCNTAATAECMKSKRIMCSDKQLDASKIEENDIVFLLNSNTGTLIGPFTAGESTDTLEEGTWYSSIQTDRFSENIKLEWEQLHELKNASDKIPFLKNIKTCPLSAIWTQQLLAALKEAPLYSEPQTR